MSGFGKDGKGVIMYDTVAQTLGTLGAALALIVATKVVTTNFRLIKAEGWLHWQDATTEEGPLMIGIARGNLTVTQIKEALDSDVLSPASTEANEQAMRPIFLFDEMLKADVASTKHSAYVSKTIRWTFTENVGFQLFCFNINTGALTTGSSIRGRMKYYGVWVK